MVVRALERLERRTAEVLYAQRRWFQLVRERQDEEEAARMKESEMVKKEAKLFRRHWKEVEARVKEKRAAEEVKRQEAALEEAYTLRKAEMSAEEGDEEWDPIEDAVEEERGAFVDMMRHLLWLGSSAQDRSLEAGVSKSSAEKQPIPDDPATTAAGIDGKGKENVDPSASKSKNARKRDKKKEKALMISKPESNGSSDVEETGEVKVELNETRENMRKRLTEGVRFQPGAGIRGPMTAGTIESPLATHGRIPGMPTDEVDRTLKEVAEIKLYLFSRLLLSQAAILPAAIRAESVDEFLTDAEVTTQDLRDLCLRVEKPSLQEVRDACADFFRGEREEDEGKSDEDSDDEEDPETKNLMKFKRNHVPDKWRSRHEEEVDERKAAISVIAESDQTLVDFGKIEDGEFKHRKVRVKVCGKTIWNYPSSSPVPRQGWLHYSIIAKNSRVFDAIELCRNWDEFWELNVLAVFRYFPCPHWEQWCGNRFRQQLLQLGFIPYLQFDEAETHTVQRQASGQGQKVHAAVEYKNVIAAHIKRNDAISRRFVPYLSMQAGTVVLLVRDAKTGRVLVTPPDEHCWLVRERADFG